MNGLQQQVQGDVIEHDGGEDFIGVEVVPQHGRNQRPQQACQAAGHQYGRQNPEAFQPHDVERHPAAYQQLPFCANIPDIGPVTDGQTGRTKEHGGSLDTQLG